MGYRYCNKGCDQHNWQAKRSGHSFKQAPGE
jgi:hypothetical protein